jgi:flagellar biosynthesis/type III secretory pathway protein FliH
LDETIVPTGVYLLPPGFKAGIIVVHQLPKTPATLWLRMLGKGKTQERAIEEIVRLSADHPYRRDVLDLLANLKAALEAQNSTEPEEQELVMKLSPIYLADLADAEENGRKEGRKEGSQEGRQAIVLRQISRRVGNLSPTIEAQIKALSIERLEELGDDLLDFQKVEDLINWLA